MPKILVIDDKKDNLISLTGLLKTYRTDYELYTAQSGIAGLRLARAEKPDTILLDIKMPEMDGYEVCRRLKDDEELKRIPIIFLTAVKTSSEDRTKGLEMGGDAYLYKPIDSGELLAQINVALRIKKAEDELRHEKESLEEKVIERTVDLEKVVNKLQESEEKFRALYNNSPDLYVSVAPDNTTILLCNETFLHKTGYSQNEVIGSSIFTIYNEECMDEVKKVFQQFVETGQVKDKELILKRKDGSKIDVNLNVNSVRDETGKILYSIYSWRDITDRILANEALRKSKANLVAAQRIAHIGSWEWDILANTALWSEETYQMFGVAPRELEKHRQDFLDSVHPDDRAKVDQALSDAINGTKEYNLEYRIVLPDKIEKVIHACAEVISNDDGKAILMRGTVHNITDRKLAENALKLSEEKFRGIFDESIAAIYLFDAQKNFIDSNQAGLDLLGYTREELLKMSIPDVDADPESVLPEHKKLLAGDRIDNYEHQLKRKDGSIITVLNNSRSLIDINMNVVGMQSTLIDITERMQAEEERRRSQENLNNLFQFTTDAIIIQNRKREILDCNAAAEELFDYSKEELITDPIIKLWDQEKTDEGQRVEYLKRAIQGQPQRFEWWGRRKDGSSFPEEIILNRTIYNGEEVIFVTIRNITERKRVEKMLQSSLIELQSIFDASPIPLFVVDSDRRVHKANNATQIFTGRTEHEMLGRRGGDVFRCIHALDVPEGCGFGPVCKNCTVRNTVLDSFRMKKSAINIETELTLLTEEVDSVHNIRFSTSYFVDNTGPRVIVALEDITDRKQAEEAVKESETKYRTLFEESHDPIYITSQDGEIIEHNKAWCNLFGYTKEEYKYINAADLFSNVADRKRFQTAIEETGHIRDLEVRYRKKDRTEIICLETATMRRDRTGKIIGYQGVIRDITKRKRDRERLEIALEDAKQGEKVKSLFLANMSHEIRTPLNSILGFSQIIEDRFKDPIDENEAEYFQIIRNSGERLMNTVHEILDISQIEAGTVPYNPRVVRLATPIEWIFKEFKSKADKKNLKFFFDNQIDDRTVEIDEPSIVKAVSNLVENAIKYTEEGHIDLILYERDSKYILSVSDTGIGISPDYMCHLYDAFSQESIGYTRKYQGLGLGLSIAKRCLDMNAVKIDVESEKDIATTFRLTFSPAGTVMDEPGRKTTPVDTEIEKIASKERPVVLLVEDDLNNLRTLEVILNGKYETPTAVSVEEAKQQLHEYDVDLILLDLSLEGDKDGLDLVAYLKAEERLKDIPVIAVTAHAFTTDRDNALKAGCDDYMSKPIDIKKLLSKINQLVKVL